LAWQHLSLLASFPPAKEFRHDLTAPLEFYCSLCFYMPALHRTGSGSGSIFQLSAEETAKASQLAQDLENAHEQTDKAATARRMFQETNPSTRTYPMFNSLRISGSHLHHKTLFPA